MPTEIAYLVSAIGLYIVMIVFQAGSGATSHSLKFLLGPRDGMEDKSVLAQRARRANANMVEALLMFVPLILAAAYLDRFNDMTALGAALFFYGRLAFAPLYWFGIPVVRTIAWFAAVVGILLILFQLNPFS